MVVATAGLPRVKLFRLLSDPGRLRVLALAAQEELSLSELGELLGDGQSQVSRRAAPLRDAGFLLARKEGTRTYLRTAELDSDPVLRDALAEGRRLCGEDGSLSRISGVVAAREDAGRAYFERAAEASQRPLLEEPFFAHLAALAPLFPGRDLAVDVGCGDGALLDVLAPVYKRVIAVDRSQVRLASAAQRLADRGFAHVSLVEGDYDDIALLRRVDELGGANLVFCARALHHASKPGETLGSFARLLRSGGHLVVLDYLPHLDETMREQGDVWLGFAAAELEEFFVAANFSVCSSGAIPAPFHSQGPDSHLPWQVVVGQKQ